VASTQNENPSLIVIPQASFKSAIHTNQIYGIIYGCLMQSPITVYTHRTDVWSLITVNITTTK